MASRKFIIKRGGVLYYTRDINGAKSILIKIPYSMKHIFDREDIAGFNSLNLTAFGDGYFNLEVPMDDWKVITDMFMEELK